MVLIISVVEVPTTIHVPKFVVTTRFSAKYLGLRAVELTTTILRQVFAVAAISWQGHLVINVAVPETTTAFPMSAAVERFKQNNLVVGVVDPSHTTVTLMFVVMGISTARKADPAVVMIMFTTRRCLYAAVTGCSVNGVDHRAVNHTTITVKVVYAATEKLFQKFMVLCVAVP